MLHVTIYMTALHSLPWTSVFRLKQVQSLLNHLIRIVLLLKCLILNTFNVLSDLLKQ